MGYGYKYKPPKKPVDTLKLFKLLVVMSYVLVFTSGLFTAKYFFLKEQAPVGPKQVILTPEILSASTGVVAVTSDQQSGMLGRVDVYLTDGKGQVLIATNPFLEPDTQYSANIAVEVAKNLSNVSLSNKNVVFSFNFTENVDVLGGPSAGAAMTVATYSAIEKKKIKNDTVITGTINKDGSMGVIGGVFEKAHAAALNNKTLFLVPNGQSNVVYYEKETKEEQVGGFIITRVNYVPKTFDLNDYAQKNWNMSVLEVSNISDAVSYMVED